MSICRGVTKPLSPVAVGGRSGAPKLTCFDGHLRCLSALIQVGSSSHDLRLELVRLVTRFIPEESLKAVIRDAEEEMAICIGT